MRHLDGTTEKRDIGSHGELLELLASRFGLTLPEGAVFRAPRSALVPPTAGPASGKSEGGAPGVRSAAGSA